MDDLANAAGLGVIPAAALHQGFTGQTDRTSRPLCYGAHLVSVHPHGHLLACVSDQGVLHTYDPRLALHLETIAIALVVFLVKGSVALAFSLAGIVAAVRFRASLNQPTDAVYMLMAIGIGLAAGTQLTSVAYLASLIFVTIILAVWKSNFGAKPAVLSGWTIRPSGRTGPGAGGGG